MAWIYKISNDFYDKIYIGLTRNTPKHRFEEHWRSRFNDNGYLHSAMALYGKEHFFVEGIEEVSEEEMGEREKYYIQKYNSLAPNGYNLGSWGRMSSHPLWFKKYKIQTYRIARVETIQRPKSI